ncbi:hypothetical protein [Flavobacterium sp. PL02]|uniref:hypothetical protein n=1 Tax=Flavobacterium sp. PL02 TaxID=3088354 RepID=UPI002B23635D|nr:hypothetical protein [Flavobacterium sp. PL02]MEA9415255.1 hypothetical protein [Flavobacterium sp. PL02]
MKTLKKFMFMAVVIFSLVVSSSCSSDNSSEDNLEESTSAEGYIKFKYNGVAYNFNPAIITSGSINIMGYEGIDDTFKSISIWLPLDFTTGSHPIVYDLSNLTTTYQANFSFKPEINNISATSGTVNITEKSDKKIAGTFSFSGSRDGKTFTITEGSFSAPKF